MTFLLSHLAALAVAIVIARVCLRFLPAETEG